MTRESVNKTYHCKHVRKGGGVGSTVLSLVVGVTKAKESVKKTIFAEKVSVFISVADPDPVGSGLFGSSGSGSGSGKIPDPDPLTTKRPL